MSELGKVLNFNDARLSKIWKKYKFICLWCKSKFVAYSKERTFQSGVEYGAESIRTKCQCGYKGIMCEGTASLCDVDLKIVGSAPSNMQVGFLSEAELLSSIH